MGVPRVIPSRPTPERISHESSSFRGGDADWPGRRVELELELVAVKSAGEGTPSTTQPTPPPWDSPKVVTRNIRPKVLPMARTTDEGDRI